MTSKCNDISVVKSAILGFVVGEKNEGIAW